MGTHRRSLILTALLALLLLLQSAGAPHLLAQGTTPPAPAADALRAAWERARAAGSYRFLSTVEQTLIPRAIPSMIGQGDMRLTLENDGAVILPDRAYLEMRVPQSALQAAAVTLLRDGSQAFMLSDGELVPVNDPLSLAAPTTDYLGYLAGAANVVRLAPPEGHPQIVRYGFDLDGPRFAAYAHAQAQALLDSQPGTPSGVQLRPASALAKLSGRGELWLNAQGLPVRQVLDVELPQASEEYDARLHMVVDLGGYGQVAALPRAVPGGDGKWQLQGGLGARDWGLGTGDWGLGAGNARGGSYELAQSLIPSPQSLVPLHVSPSSFFLFLLAVLALILIRYYRRNPHQVYMLLAGVLVAAMVVTPLLQAGQIVRFSERQVRAAAERAVTQQQLLQALGLPEASPAPKPSPTPPQPAATRDLRPDQVVPQALPARAPRPVQSVQVQATGPGAAASRCGEGSTGVDTDGDGLSDAFELCLGSDPYNPDSDGDGIPDGVEVNGFELGGRLWTSDPLKADSNGDGRPDMLEWPAPYGTAASYDNDGDGIPNLWDEDDDGDGVPDKLDLSPMAVTGYSDSLNLSTRGADVEGYEYIEFQLQPQNMAHLRYSTTALDWPDDEKGSVQDLDHSQADLRLSPFLLVKTNTQPSAELAAKYGFRSWVDGDHFVLLVPLLPVGDGGAVYAFYGKVAYEPGQLDDIQWQAQMVWMVQAQVDRSVLVGGVPRTVSDTVVLHQYKDTFRLTGLQVTRSKGYEAAVLGTPASAGEDLYLFKMLAGLRQTFMSYAKLEGQVLDQTALTQIGYRFDPAAGATITHTFGVPAHLVKMTVPQKYAHHDEGVAGLGSDLIPGLLDTYYQDNICHDAAGNPVTCASMIIAYEESAGGYDLADMVAPNPANLHVNLADIPLVTNRGVRLAMYERTTGRGWQIMEPARMLELVEQRYAGAYNTALRELYPNLKADDLRFINYTAYLWATTSSMSAIAADGQLLKPELPDETALALNLVLPAEEDAAANTGLNYMALVFGMADQLSYGATALWAGSDTFNLIGKWSKGSSFGNAWGAIGAILFDASTVASLVMTSINAACQAESDLAMCRNAEALKWANVAVSSLAIIAQAQYAADLLLNAIPRIAMGLPVEGISAVAGFAQGVGMVVGIAVTWVQFGLLVAGPHDPASLRVGVGMAIVSTIWYIVLFAINFIPVVGQIISAILALIDMIIGLFTGLFTDETWSVAKIVLNFFYDAKVLTSLSSAEFGPFSSGLKDASLGLVAGNTLYVQVGATGVMTKTKDGNDDDLRKSYVEGVIQPGTGSSFSSQDMSQPRNCRVVGDELRCSNTAKAGFTLTAAVNGLASFLTFFNYEYAWAEYGLYGAFRYDTKTSLETLPEEEDQKANDLYLDVLPANLDGLWIWAALTNPDRDGDGLTNAQELALGSDPNNWDSDGDGLSDKFEVDEQERLGTNPLLFDTDGDGLSDGLEYRLGSKINQADSDLDGLGDGEEVYHAVYALSGGRYQPSGEWAGGWTVSLPGGKTARVYSDPLRPNPDGDYLSDAAEKRNGYSPFAANAETPLLALDAAPLRAQLGGKGGVYAQPGETVTMDLWLASAGPLPVTTTLSLCLPSFLEDVQGGQLHGDRTPAVQQGTCAGGGTRLSWTFSGASTLQIYEVVSTTVTARVAAATGTMTGNISAELPYKGLTLAETGTVHVDADNPTARFLAPDNDALLRGSSYVVGGTAQDVGSWVTRVELGIGPNASSLTYQAATGISPWAYSWALPADGNYVLVARAYDAVGHSALSSAVNVTVDNTAPAASLATSGFTTGVTDTVHLSGTATDTLSGVQRVQISVNGQPWRTVTLASPGATSTTWAYDWPAGAGAQGTHQLKLRAFDRAGNESAPQSGSFVVDRVPPASYLSGGADPGRVQAVAVGQAHTLSGVADEGGNLPQPAIPAALRTGMDVYGDATVWLGLSSIHDNDGGVVAAWLGDMNNDRLGDLAVGLPGAMDGAGQVAVAYGKAGGWRVPPGMEMLAQSGSRFGGAAGKGLGSIVAAAGDVDGDGYDDLLIGEGASERAFLVFGNPGPLGGVTLEGPQAGYWSVLAAPATISGLAAAGDVNGDGLGDLLVTAGGSTYLLLGRPRPWAGTRNVQNEAVLTVAGTLSASGLGDVNGDGLADWATASSGQVRLYLGNSTPSATARATFTADAAPRLLALGDVNRDGKADFLYSNDTSPTLVLGNALADSWTRQSFPGYGGLLAAPGDVNGDGYDDILLGNASGLVSLIVGQAGSSLSAMPLATVAGVAAAASAPYAAGADVNADGSSDLLLIPSATAAAGEGYDALGLGGGGHLAPSALPQAGSLTVQQERMGGAHAAALIADTFYVDDDGACGGNTPCYSTIAAAVAAADSAGDTIIVYPGVYAPFTVSGAGKSNLTIRGVDPDAVFIDAGGGDYAVHISDANNVHLSQLTVRNATKGVWLERAGVEGQATRLDHLLLHSCSNPLYMDRTSTAALVASTLVGDGGAAHPIVNVAGAGTTGWASVASPGAPLSSGGALVGKTGGLYALPGGSSTSAYEYTASSDSWSTLGTLPVPLAPSSVATAIGDIPHIVNAGYWPNIASANGTIKAVAFSASGNLYVGGDFTQIGGISANRVAMWSCTTGNWQALGAGADAMVRALAVGADGSVYVGGDFTSVAGGTVSAKYVAKYALATGWAALGGGVDGIVRALAVDGSTLYAGGDFTTIANGATVAMHVAKWNGSAWVQVIDSSGRGGLGVSDTVYALAVDTQGWLYVGGEFHNITKSPMGDLEAVLRADHVALYAFNTWTYLASGVYNDPAHPEAGVSVPFGTNGPVYALATGGAAGQVVYIGGSFSSFGGDPTNNIAKKGQYPDVQWTLGSGVSGPVTALATVGNNLVYAGGTFGVQKWTISPQGWSTVGSGSFDGASALAANADDIFLGYGSALGRWSNVHLHDALEPVYRADIANANGDVLATVLDADGNLYVGGSFTQIGGISANRVAKWIRSSGRWQTLGGGTNSTVRVLVLAPDGSLYAGGDFTSAGGVYANHVAKWSGGAWSVLGMGTNGTNGRVNALAVSATGTLYAGGQFSQAGGADAMMVAKWNGSSWSALSSGTDGEVYALAVDYAGTLYAGGAFWQAGGKRAEYLATWDGTTWSHRAYYAEYLDPHNPDMGIAYDIYGTNGPVYALAANSTRDRIYVGGYYSRIGTKSAGSLSYLTVGVWEAVSLGNYYGSEVKALSAVGTNQVYAGGSFVGGASYWNGSAWSALGSGLGSVAAVAGNSAGEAYMGYGTHLARWWPNRGWQERAPYPIVLQEGAVAVDNGAGQLYVLTGGTSNTFYRYDDASDTWTVRASLSGSFAAGGALAWAEGYAYALRALSGGGYGFYRYDPTGNTWATLAIPTEYQAYLGSGLSLVYDGYGALFALVGKSSKVMLAYKLAQAEWLRLPDPTVTFSASQGHGLARAGDYLYVYAGSNLYRFGTLGPLHTGLSVEGSAFVAPLGSTAPAWLSLGSAGGDLDCSVALGTGNAWVAPGAATWGPALPAGAATHTPDQAAFVNAGAGVYRLGAGSILEAGYHRYRAEAHVYASQAACDRCGAGGDLTWGETAFATIPEAIASGAARVLVHPGRYPQPFYLVSGVEVYGAGAEATIIEAPAGGSGYLVSAEGIAAATLARLTLAGNADWGGLLVEGGANGLRVTRNIIRGAATGLRVRGNSRVEVANNTLVKNVNGMVAEGTNPVNVRNTLFAYNTGTGLTYSSPSSLTNNYNGFWGNATHQSPLAAGQGNLFLDPRLVSLQADDYRLAKGSPLIDKGAPNDPAPPGTGGRADIGYAEYGGAAFYASKSYSPIALNDGLTWGVDAFATIQGALDAARETLVGLQGVVPEGGYRVGVGVGTWYERLSVPSYVQLVGAGAQATIIDAGGSGSPVTLDGVVQAGVSGLTLQGAGSDGAGVEVRNAANSITVTRNVIRNNASRAVRLTGRSSGEVASNTIVGNTGAAVLAEGGAARAEVRNNIVSGNGYGLRALSGGLIRGDYNLLYNNSGGDLDGVAPGAHDVSGDPAFAGAGYYVLSANSPALDAADPLAAVPTGGGLRADLGYRELVASPLVLFCGPQIASAVTGNSGVAGVKVGVVAVTDATQPVTATLPTSWSTLTPGSSGQPLFFWSHSFTPLAAGLYRVYSRAADAAGNEEGDSLALYGGSFVADNIAPSVGWVSTPPASTGAAAVRVVADVTSHLNVAGQERFDVGQVAFRVSGPGGTVTYPAQWLAPLGDPTQARQFAAWLPLGAGATHTIVPVAVDEAGHEGLGSSQSTTTTASGHNATVTSHASGAAVRSATLDLAGQVRFTTASGTGQVAVQVDGGTAVQATLVDPTAQLTGWTATVIMWENDGSHTLTVTPSRDGTNGTASTLTVTLDRAAPALTVDLPTAGAYVTRTVSFQGSASDALSGLARVQVSIDGGCTWREAVLTGGVWSLRWDLTELQDYVSYPARVRAVDKAGNSTVVERAVTVDNLPPSDLAVTFGQPAGQHLERGSSLSITWGPAVDGSGTAQVLLLVDQSARGEPTAVVSGASASATLNAIGDWYAHLAVRDAAGNQALYHYGPWHVRDMANASFSARRQSIVLDGFIDLDHDEWRATDLLGSDARGYRPQQLYTTWDGEAIYLGWSGAWWTLDGILWAYLDVAAGGSANRVVGGGGLPFAADLAVRIAGPRTGMAYRWNGSSWGEGSMQFAHGPSGDTEARVPWSVPAGQTVRLVALATHAQGSAGGQAWGAAVGEEEVWAILPPTNNLGGDLSQNYLWNGVGGVSDPNAGQPQARTVGMTVTSPQASDTACCAGSGIDYRVVLHNPEASAIAGLRLDVAGSPGLNYPGHSGSSWSMNLPEIAAGGTSTITLSANLASDLSGLTSVTTIIALSAGSVALTDAPVLGRVSHRVDGQAPTLAIDALAGSAIAAGRFRFTGAATDGEGSGVARVEVRPAGGSWQTAVGSAVWSAELDVPAGSQFTLEARAVDGCGHTSATQARTFNVDSTPPVLSFAVPDVVKQMLPVLSGNTADPQPVDALVGRVEVQVDNEGSAWLPAVGPFAPAGGTQAWTWTWNVPPEDSVAHRLRARAFDGVGLSTTTGWQSTLVDNVAPRITVTLRLDEAVVSDYLVGGGAAPLGLLSDEMIERLVPGGWLNRAAPTPSPTLAARLQAATGVPVLKGAVSDGSGVQQIYALVYAPSGQAYTQTVSLAGGSWEYTPRLPSPDVGLYTLRIVAADVHGNSRVQGPYDLWVRDQAIDGLRATNDGPSSQFSPTTLIATVLTGTNVVYTWDFGDGSAPASGRIASHAYSTVGRFTVTLTATNGVGSRTTTTEVTVNRPTGYLELSPLWPAICAGWDITFDITYRNNEYIPLTNVRLAVTVPDRTMVVFAGCTPGLANGPGLGQVMWQVGTLGVGQTATRRLVLHLYSSIPHGTLIQLPVTAYATEGDPVARAAIVEVRTDGVCQNTPTPTPMMSPTPSTTPTVTTTPVGTLTTTPTTSATPEGTLTPTPTRSGTETPTPTPTVTPTREAGDLALSGVIYGERAGAVDQASAQRDRLPLVGARVAANLCAGETFADTTDNGGWYEIVIPAASLEGCDELTLEVSARGYGTLRQRFSLTELRADPRQDLTLVARWDLWLPAILK